MLSRRKHCKVFSAVIITVSMVFAQENVWNGTKNTSWYNSSQTKFTIKTAEQLAGLAELVNNGNNFEGKTIKLGNNITLNDTTNWQNWETNPPAREWVRIGYWETVFGTDYGFYGTFDGCGYVVYGVYINDTHAYQGLFGLIGGTIKNLGVVASHIKGHGALGGFAGGNFGTITNSYSTGNVVGSTELGGLVGGNLGTITNSYSIGNVKGSDDIENTYGEIGGLVGGNSGIITNSYSTGSVLGNRNVGGLVGYDGSGTITNSYATGSVLGNRNVGGLIGKTLDQSSTITNSYYDSQTSGQNDDDGRGEPRTTAQMKQKSTFADWDFTNIWAISSNKNKGYPYLSVIGNNPITTPIKREKFSNKKINSFSFAGIQNGQINLQLQAGNYTIELYNLQGRLISNVEINAINGVNTTDIKTNKLSGMFVLNVKQKGVSVFKQKIVVRR